MHRLDDSDSDKEHLPYYPSQQDQDISEVLQCDPAKRRPLPPPPPPYSTSDDPVPSLSRVATSTTPEPEPPVIMAPNEQGAQARVPCDSFLCHSTPANTWIAVETSESEYILLVRLPGFRRDGITIATRRRRILHVVADSWEPEGGHFERRVSFGYDADLAQVRAEFDGEMLRIVVPRRVSLVITA